MINSLKSPTVNGASDGMLPTTSCSLPSSSGISSLRLPTERGKEKRLLPFGRCAATIKPRIGRLAWTSKGSDNLSGGKLGKRFGEGHGQTIPEKEMSAMQKIILVLRLQCGHVPRMTATQYRVSFTVENVRHSTQWFNSETEAMNSKWMDEDNAEIVTREHQTPARPW